MYVESSTDCVRNRCRRRRASSSRAIGACTQCAPQRARRGASAAAKTRAAACRPGDRSSSLFCAGGGSRAAQRLACCCASATAPARAFVAPQSCDDGLHVDERCDGWGRKRGAPRRGVARSLPNTILSAPPTVRGVPCEQPSPSVTPRGRRGAEQVNHKNRAVACVAVVRYPLAPFLSPSDGAICTSAPLRAPRLSAEAARRAATRRPMLPRPLVAAHCAKEASADASVPSISTIHEHKSLGGPVGAQAKDVAAEATWRSTARLIAELTPRLWRRGAATSSSAVSIVDDRFAMATSAAYAAAASCGVRRPSRHRAQ